MKKITAVEIFIVFIVVIGLGFCFGPKLALSLEQKQYGRMQTNAAMLTSKILAEFSDNKNTKKPSEIANNLAEEMNKLVKNPIDKKNKAYSIKEECAGCIVINPDDKMKSITLIGKDKENKLITRTVIQPPSYVTFNKDFKKNDRKQP